MGTYISEDGLILFVNLCFYPVGLFYFHLLFSSSPVFCISRLHSVTNSVSAPPAEHHLFARLSLHSQRSSIPGFLCIFSLCTCVFSIISSKPEGFCIHICFDVCTQLTVAVHWFIIVNSLPTDILGVKTESRLTKTVNSSPHWDKVCTHSVSNIITQYLNSFGFHISRIRANLDFLSQHNDND